MAHKVKNLLDLVHHVVGLVEYQHGTRAQRLAVAAQGIKVHRLVKLGALDVSA